MAVEASEKKEGWLSKVFWGAAKLVTIGLAAAVAWQIFLDPLFFPLFHDATNIMAQAWVMKMNTMFGWIPKLTGLTKEQGLLSPLMKAFMADEIKTLTPVSKEVMSNAFPNGISSLDMLSPAMP